MVDSQLPSLVSLSTKTKMEIPLAILGLYDAGHLEFTVVLPTTTTQEQGLRVAAHVAAYLYDRPSVENGSQLRLINTATNFMVPFKFPTKDVSAPYPTAEKLYEDMVGKFKLGRVRDEHSGVLENDKLFFYIQIQRPRDIEEDHKRHLHGGMLMDSLYGIFPVIADSVEVAVAFALSDVFAAIIEKRGAFTFRDLKRTPPKNRMPLSQHEGGGTIRFLATPYPEAGPYRAS